MVVVDITNLTDVQKLGIRLGLESLIKLGTGEGARIGPDAYSYAEGDEQPCFCQGEGWSLVVCTLLRTVLHDWHLLVSFRQEFLDQFGFRAESMVSF